MKLSRLLSSLLLTNALLLATTTLSYAKIPEHITERYNNLMAHHQRQIDYLNDQINSLKANESSNSGHTMKLHQQEIEEHRARMEQLTKGLQREHEREKRAHYANRGRRYSESDANDGLQEKLTPIVHPPGPLSNPLSPLETIKEETHRSYLDIQMKLQDPTISPTYKAFLEEEAKQKLHLLEQIHAYMNQTDTVSDPFHPYLTPPPSP